MAAELIGALAASAAAVLSGTTLFLTMRREERKWRRDSLVSTLVSFLDSSFNLPDTAAFETRRSGGDMFEIRASTKKAHDDLCSSLTRLRVLASARVVEQAERVHSVEDTVIDAVVSASDDELMSLENWDELVARRDVVRTDLLTTARRDLGLGKARRVDLERPRPAGI